MAAKMSVTGDKAIYQALRRLTRIDVTVIKPTIELAIRPIFAEAKSGTPKSTGALASSLVTRVASRKGKSRAHVVWNRTKVKYGAFVSLGTKFKAEEDFLGYAFMSRAKRAEDILIRGIVNGIDREWNA